MALWPFKKSSSPSGPTAQELREKLFAAAKTGDMPALRKACRKWGEHLAPHIDAFVAWPDDLERTEQAEQEFSETLKKIAVCLDEDCDFPELLDKLAIPQVATDNPLGSLEQWYAQLERRTARLEYNALITEGRALFATLAALPDEQSMRPQSMLHSKLGDLLLHSGQAEEAVAEYESALKAARDGRFAEGVVLQLRNLMEAYGRIGDPKITAVAEHLKAIVVSRGGDPRMIDMRVTELQARQGICRVICIKDQNAFELDAVESVADEPIELQLHRNHRPLHKTQILTERAKDHASSGDLATAIELFDEASRVDPHDPEPVYQLGRALLDAGRYDEAAEAFAEVEALAPGWFNCRSSHWIASNLASGRFTDQEMLALRTTEDGGLDPERRIQLAAKAAEASPDFAPLHLALGNLCREEGQRTAAESAYRAGLAIAEEPDLQTRLCLGLGSVLPLDSEERTILLKQAQNPRGNLVAAASAKLMSLPRAA